MSMHMPSSLRGCASACVCVGVGGGARQIDVYARQIDVYALVPLHSAEREDGRVVRLLAHAVAPVGAAQLRVQREHLHTHAHARVKARARARARVVREGTCTGT